MDHRTVGQLEAIGLEVVILEEDMLLDHMGGHILQGQGEDMLGHTVVAVLGVVRRALVDREPLEPLEGEALHKDLDLVVAALAGEDIHRDLLALDNTTSYEIGEGASRKRWFKIKRLRSSWIPDKRPIVKSI